MDTTANLIEITKLANKSYSFPDNRNPKLIADHWFQNSPEGQVLFLVFFTLACRYSKCTGCNLPSIMSNIYVDYKDLMTQADDLFNRILNDTDKQIIKKIILSNNGSVLDEDTFSTTALIYLISQINLHCPNVEVVTIETRPEYVDIEELEVIARALLEGQTPTALEVAIGFEAFDEKIRNEIFNKGLSFEKIDQLASNLSKINEKFVKKNPRGYRKMKLKTYFMLKPIHGITDKHAVTDVMNGINYLHDLASKYNMEINMHLNPTFVARGTPLEEEFRKGNFYPPSLALTREAMLFAKNKNISLFVGLNDEGLAVEGGTFSCKTPEEKILYQKIEGFNVIQNFEILS
jgi:radical SAM enzyme (TIGR01210 family)